MPKLILHLFGIFLLVAFYGGNAVASDSKEIGSVSVLTEKQLTIPLSELASLFTRENMVTVSGSFGDSQSQEKRIEEGETADLFITSDAQLIQQLKIKGMVDIHSIGRIASHRDIHYVAAVVASENMPAAREFLAFLKSDEARTVFRKNGLSVQ